MISLLRSFSWKKLRLDSHCSNDNIHILIATSAQVNDDDLVLPQLCGEPGGIVDSVGRLQGGDDTLLL